MQVKNQLSVAMLVISFWVLIFIAVEYGVTAHRYLRDSIPQLWRFLGLLLLIAGGLLTLNKLERKKIELGSKVLVACLLLFLFTLGTYKQYSLFYDNLERIPKIRSVSKNWSIQGDRIAIEGKNFGDKSDEASKVRVGELEFLIISWGNKRVVAEQPVYGEYFTDDLLICNARGNCTSAGNFSIKDPAEVLR